MFIDDPNFPRRKVVYANQPSYRDFGSERMQLANFVAE